MSTQTLVVPEISARCKAAIEGALTPLVGVRQAVVDIAAKRVSVELDAASISRGRLVAAIETRGYHVETTTETRGMKR